MIIQIALGIILAGVIMMFISFILYILWALISVIMDFIGSIFDSKNWKWNK